MISPKNGFACPICAYCAVLAYDLPYSCRFSEVNRVS
jgi:hypothetical protein